jgi:hypothetical protein
VFTSCCLVSDCSSLLFCICHCQSSALSQLTHDESKLSYDRLSVSQSVLVSGHHLGLMTNFSFSFTEIIFRPLQFFSMGRPLWWEDGPVIYSYKCYWTLPSLSLSGEIPTKLETISYSLIWECVPFLLPLMTCRSTWKYPNLPPIGVNSWEQLTPNCLSSGLTQKKTLFSTVPLLLHLHLVLYMPVVTCSVAISMQQPAS